MTNVPNLPEVAQQPQTQPAPTPGNPFPAPWPGKPGPSVEDQAAEHYHVGGSAGGAGDNEAVCACGVTYAGFDTHAAAVALLNTHITAANAKPRPAELVSAAAAGQPALVRIARTNMLRAITRLSFAVERSALPAPVAVAFLRGRQAVELEFDTIAEAEAWAVELRVDREAQLSESRDRTGVLYRGYLATAEWRGFEVTLGAVERATEQTSAVPA